MWLHPFCMLQYFCLDIYEACKKILFSYWGESEVRYRHICHSNCWTWCSSMWARQSHTDTPTETSLDKACHTDFDQVCSRLVCCTQKPPKVFEPPLFMASFWFVGHYNITVRIVNVFDLLVCSLWFVAAAMVNYDKNVQGAASCKRKSNLSNGKLAAFVIPKANLGLPGERQAHHPVHVRSQTRCSSPGTWGRAIGGLIWNKWKKTSHSSGGWRSIHFDVHPITDMWKLIRVECQMPVMLLVGTSYVWSNIQIEHKFGLSQLGPTAAIEDLTI